MKKIITRIAIYVGLGFVALFLVLELPHAKHYSQASLVVQKDIPTMAKEADLVLVGTVEKQLGTTRVTDGTGEDMVFSRWLIQGDRAMKGQRQNVVIRVMGGRYGLTVVDVEDSPILQKGDRAVFFLRKKADVKGDYEIVGVFQGMYKIPEDSAITEATQEVSMTKVKLKDLESTVASAIKQ